MSIISTISGINSLNSANSAYNNFLSQLGLKSWTLKEAKYNGCTFAVFQRIPFLKNSGLIDAGLELYASYNQIFGDNDFDNNDIGSLKDTVLGTLQFEDELITQIAVKKLPFANRCNTENMGFGGFNFKMTLLFLGPDYQKAIQNFEHAIVNPPQDNYLVLEHPTRGVIPGITRVVSYKIDTNLNNYNGATINITFKSEQSLIQQLPEVSLLSNRAGAISAVLDSAIAIQGAIATITDFLGLNGNTTPSPTNQTVAKNIQSSNSNLSSTLFNCTNYIYKNSNTGIANTALSAASLNKDFIPVALQQNITYTSSQGNYLIDFYSQQCNDAINVIKSYNLGGNANKMINTINESIGLFYNLTILMASNVSTSTYITPYDMSIREVLVRNNLVMSQAVALLNINPNIPSANYIPKNFIVNLL